MTAVDFGPMVTAAADYLHAVARLDEATGDAESAWLLLPAALDSPGTQLAVGRYVGPAHQLSTALLQAADALHDTLFSAVQPLRRLSTQADAAPDAPGAATELAATEADCAAAIGAIRGGEAGSVALPCPEAGTARGGTAQARPVDAAAEPFETAPPASTDSPFACGVVLSLGGAEAGRRGA